MEWFNEMLLTTNLLNGLEQRADESPVAIFDLSTSFTGEQVLAAVDQGKIVGLINNGTGLQWLTQLSYSPLIGNDELTWYIFYQGTDLHFNISKNCWEGPSSQGGSVT